MSADDAARPRRALGPDEETQEPLLSDDTPADADAGPRRGFFDEDDLDDQVQGEEADAAQDEPEAAEAAEPAGEEQLNPFARPGTDAAAIPIPPTDPEPMIPAPVFPRSSGEVSESPSPAPRRSALSTTTPVEIDSPAEDKPAASGSWAAAHRRTLVTWAVAGLVGALVVGLIAFFVARGGNPGTETPTPTETTTPPPPEPAEEADLVTAEDLAPIAPASEWVAIDTTTSPAAHSMRAFCLSTVEPAYNPTHSFQRTLGTSGEDKLAALHRIDVFGSPLAAAEAMDDRITALSSCTEVPALLERSTDVSGLAERAFQVTILQQENPAKYHTLLLTQEGAALQILDVARDAEPTEADALAQALLRTQAALAEGQHTTGPGEPVVTPAPVPPAEPSGWLVPIDLPRMHAGTGRWTMSEPRALEVTRTGCENMEISTVAGPSERWKSAYALTQDPNVPERFGIDEMLFTFPSNEDAAYFVTRLGANLASCADRVNTAEITEHPAVPAKDAAGNSLSSRVFTLEQAISDDETIPYQLIISVAGDKVAYTIISVTHDFQFTEEQLNELAARISVRASQLEA